jgi:hypothetical protein
VNYVQIWYDDESGEGGLGIATTRLIERLTDEDPLLAADILKDWICELNRLYEVASHNAFAGYKS